MQQWCDVLLVLISQLALWANNLWSWLLENWGALAEWWERQERAIKILVLAAVTLVLGAGAWALGAFVFACPGWPSVAVAAFMIVSAIAGLFIGGKRYEAGKADMYQQKLQAALYRIDAMQLQIEGLEAALAQARRDMV